MIERRREPFFRCRIGPLRAPVEQVTRLRKQPRIPECATCDHDAGAVRVLPHREDIAGRLDVAVADDRDRERLHDGGDLVPVG